MASHRPKQEIIAEIDRKIAYHENCIAKFKARREAAMRPPSARSRKTSMKKALDAVKGTGLTPDEIMQLAAKMKKD